jgi:hypothetical protein
MPVIQVNNVADKKRIIRKRRAEEEEERHKGLLAKKIPVTKMRNISPQIMSRKGAILTTKYTQLSENIHHIQHTYIG